jgi:hypothetical protein
MVIFIFRLLASPLPELQKCDDSSQLTVVQVLLEAGHGGIWPAGSNEIRQLRFILAGDKFVADQRRPDAALARRTMTHRTLRGVEFTSLWFRG